VLEEKRGTQKGFEYITSNRVMLTYELPLNEIVLDFYDRLKSCRAVTRRWITTWRVLGE
jgi:GTP-binding protein LepA